MRAFIPIIVVTVLCSNVVLSGYAGDSGTEGSSVSVSNHRMMALHHITQVAREPWSSSATVVRVDGSRLSGSLHASATVDLTTGEVTEPTAPGMLFSGNWTVLAPEEGLGNGSFRWVDPVPTNTRNEDEPPRMPFAQGGTVLCAFDPKASGSDMFKHVRLLPDGPSWTAGAKELVTDPSPIEAISAAIQAGRMDEVLGHKNPILAVMVVAKVIEHKRLRGEDKVPLIEKSWETHPEARAAIAYVLATSASPDATDVMQALIRKASTVEGLLPLYEGLWTACWYELWHQKQSGTVRHEAIADIARELRDCAARLGEHAVAERLDAVIDRLGR